MASSRGRLFARLQGLYGHGGDAPADSLFVIEPELRSETTFSRLVPDVAAWRRSTSGWPDRDRTPIELAPDWVAEVLSKSTEATDRGEKLGAYGSMGVGWAWLVDGDGRRVETFVNVRGRMEPGPVLFGADAVRADPFGPATFHLGDIFA